MLKIYALNGFLGKPSDWNILQDVDARDPMSVCEPGPAQGLWEWASCFNQFIETQNATKRVLMGYSMGGRLALHALLDNPDLWTAAVIISAHPGLSSKKDKLLRLKHDEQWALRMQNEPWESLMHSWNSQAVFAKSKLSTQRNECDYSRTSLANALRFWSLGRQEFLSERISKLQIPILWVAGKEDFSYASSAESMVLNHPKSQIWLAEDAGHRVPWENTEHFQRHLYEFIYRI